ncbi:hypothetical protein D3C81_1820380 [compost metagenome]
MRLYAKAGDQNRDAGFVQPFHQGREIGFAGRIHKRYFAHPDQHDPQHAVFDLRDELVKRL